MRFKRAPMLHVIAARLPMLHASTNPCCADGTCVPRAPAHRALLKRRHIQRKGEEREHTRLTARTGFRSRVVGHAAERVSRVCAKKSSGTESNPGPRSEMDKNMHCRRAPHWVAACPMHCALSRAVPGDPRAETRHMTTEFKGSYRTHESRLLREIVPGTLPAEQGQACIHDGWARADKSHGRCG